MKPIISPNLRIRHPEHFSVGDYSIVDDYSYFSTKVRIGRCTHIASGCTIAGGMDRQFSIGDFCSISSGVRIWCTSDDFTNDLVTLLPPDMEQVKTHLITGDVSFADYTAIGANAVVMPNNKIPEGVTIGALSFVPAKYPFEPWTVYAGIPIRKIGARNKENALRQAALLNEHMATRDN